MLKRSFRNYLPLLPATIVTFCLTTMVWIPQSALIPRPSTGLVEATEFIAPFFLLIFFSLLFPYPYEIELSLVCGVKTTRFAFSKALPIALYTLISIWIMDACHRHVPDATTYFETMPRTRLYVPENYKVYLMISALVTVLFFSALFFFFRVLTRNYYIPVGLGLLVISYFDDANLRIQSGSIGITRCILDPYITTYFIGDTVPNAMAAQSADLAGLTNAWTCNRLLFLGMAVVLLVATWLLLRREKLHKGLND